MSSVLSPTAEVDLINVQDISRLRRLLEPLSVAYERYVATNKLEPAEMLFELCPMDASENKQILSGEELQAANECWRALRKQECKRHLKRIESANS